MALSYVLMWSRFNINKKNITTRFHSPKHKMTLPFGWTKQALLAQEEGNLAWEIRFTSLICSVEPYEKTFVLELLVGEIVFDSYHEGGYQKQKRKRMQSPRLSWKRRSCRWCRGRRSICMSVCGTPRGKKTINVRKASVLVIIRLECLVNVHTGFALPGVAQAVVIQSELYWLWFIPEFFYFVLGSALPMLAQPTLVGFGWILLRCRWAPAA